MKTIYFKIILGILFLGISSITFSQNVSFTADNTQGCAPLVVNFTNTSSLNPTGITYTWNFGDGFQFVGTNASHSFVGGNYNVYLEARDFFGNMMGSFSLNINIQGSNGHFYLSSGYKACVGQSINIGVNDMNNGTQWDYGDGSTSNNNWNMHSYNSPGIYTITLQENTSCGPYTVTEQITIADTVHPYVHASSQGGNNFCPNTPIQFQDDYDAVSYLWDFGDSSFSTAARPIHQYSFLGQHAVILRASNQCGQTTIDTLIITISSNNYISSNFNYWPNNACPGDFISFNGGSAGFYTWFFGDGTISNLQNPSHSFADTGTYQIKLRVTNGCGQSDSTFQDIHIQFHPENNPPHSTIYFNNFNNWTNGNSGPPTLIDTLTVCPNTLVEFTTNQNNNSGQNFVWTFEGGLPATGANASHVFINAGLHHIKLITTNSCGGKDSAYKWVFVNPSIMPVAELQSIPDNICTGEQVYFFDNRYDTQNHYKYSIWFGDGTSQLNFTNVADTNLYVLARHVYSTAGIYHFTFKVSNACGNSDSLKKTITVGPNSPSNPQYVVENSSNSSNKSNNWTDFGNPSGGNDYQLNIPIHFDQWTPDLNDKFYLIFWHGTVTPGNNMPDPIALALKHGLGTAHVYVPPTVDTVTIAAAWFCNGELEGNNGPSAFAFLGTMPVVPGTITDIPEPGIQISGWDGTCDTTQSPNQNAVCPGEFVRFIVAGGHSYKWHFGDNSAIDTNQIAFHAYQNAGIYNAFVEVTNTCGQTDTIFTKVYSNNTIAPQADIDISNGWACTNMPIIFRTRDNSWGMGNHDSKTYLWDFGDGTSSSLKNAVHSYSITGNFNITLTVSNHCGSNTYTRNIYINGPQVNLNVNEGCHNANNASVQVSANGNWPISYQWSNGASGQNLNNLLPGTYILTVTSSDGCHVIDTILIQNPAPVNGTINVTNVSCFGQSDGQVFVTPIGGNAPYFFLWSHGSEGSIVSGLSPLTYTVTIIDAGACSIIKNATITEPVILTATSNSIEKSCYSDNSGSIEVSVTGGTLPYSYSWSNNATTQTLNGAPAGIYFVTITDSRGCITIKHDTINEPTAIILSTSTNDATCNTSNGSASVNPTGGNPPYAYLWNDGSIQTSFQAINLGAGAYQVIVHDANNCIAYANVAVNNSGAPVVSMNSTDISCYNYHNGSASVANVTGGSTPYSYLWSNDSTGISISNLAPGDYKLTVTDFLTCKTISIIHVSQPEQITITSSQMNVNCYGDATGKAFVSASGGTTPITFTWTGNISGDSITLLTANTYYVTATDSHSCTNSTSVTITEPSAISSNISSTNAICHGDNNGTASVTCTGGTSPYGYNWYSDFTMTTMISTGTTCNALAAGTYYLKITDSNLCTTSNSVVISQPRALAANETINHNILCNNQCNGSAGISTSGGIAPYYYTWDNGHQTASSDSLCAGQYIVTVTDNVGCNIVKNFSITEPPAIHITFARTNPSCANTCDGQLVATFTGGTGLLYPSWDDASHGDTRFNLCTGTYTVTLVDDNLCTAIASKGIFAPQDITPIIYFADISCNGDHNGMATAHPFGGTSPYTFVWSNANTNDTISGLTAGQYMVTITDNHNCTKIDSIVITEPTSLLVDTTITHASSPTANDGSIALLVSGGTQPYNYHWQNSTVTLPNLTNLTTGIYNVTVSDAHGCSVSDTIYVSFASSISSASLSEIVKIYPNPTNDILNIANANEATIELFNAIGVQLLSVKNSGIIERFDLSSYPAGQYLIRIAKNGKTIVRKVNLK